MLTSIISAIIGTCIAANGTPAQPACQSQDALPTAAELKAMHAEMLAAVKTMVLRQKVVELRKPTPGTEERLSAFLSQRAEDMRTQAASRPKTEVESRLLEGQPTVEGALAALRLNYALALEQTVQVDFVGGRERCDTRDLRAVEQLAREYAIDRQSLNTFDQTGATIRTSTRNVQLIPRANRLAVLGTDDLYNPDEHAHNLGILPVWMFGDDMELQVAEVVPTVPDELTVVGRRGGNVKFSATLRKDSGYRFSALTVYLADGWPYHELTAGDYRRVGGILVPFRTSRTLKGRTDDRCLVQRREVLSVEFNTELASDAFEPPADYHVQR